MFALNAQDSSVIAAVAQGAAMLAAASTLAVPSPVVRRAGQVVAAIGLLVSGAVSGATFIAFGWALLIAIGAVLDVHRVAPVVSFSGEEQALRETIFAAVPAERARHILDQGFWLRLRAGETVLRPGGSSAYSLILGSGRARLVDCDGRIERRGPGALLSETECRTAVLDTPAKLWCAPAYVLRSISI